jgi:hypothetical protein
MNWYFAAAAAVAFTVGFIHSFLGERLVFNRMRSSGFIPVDGGSVLRESHVRILWASWHLVTVLGWLVAAVLVWLSLPVAASLAQSFLTQAIGAALLLCAAVVFVATKGRHPGWAGLLIAAILTALGRA